MQITPRDSTGTVVFLTSTVVGWRFPYPLKCALKMTPPFEHNDLDQYPLRRIAGDVHIYLNFALKAIRPFSERRFREISLNI